MRGSAELVIFTSCVMPIKKVLLQAHTNTHSHVHLHSVGDKVALVDASHEKFHDLWMDTLEQQLKALGGCCLLPVIEALMVYHIAQMHGWL